MRASAVFTTVHSMPRVLPHNKRGEFNLKTSVTRVTARLVAAFAPGHVTNHLKSLLQESWVPSVLHLCSCSLPFPPGFCIYITTQQADSCTAFLLLVKGRFLTGTMASSNFIVSSFTPPSAAR